MDIRILRSYAASAADFYSSRNKHDRRDVSTPFLDHFGDHAGFVSELYLCHARLGCAEADSAIIEPPAAGAAWQSSST